MFPPNGYNYGTVSFKPKNGLSCDSHWLFSVTPGTFLNSMPTLNQKTIGSFHIFPSLLFTN
jgi:hypothetical protein